MALSRSHLQGVGNKSGSQSQIMLIDLKDAVKEASIADVESVLGRESGPVQFHHVNEVPDANECEKMPEPMVVVLRYRGAASLDQVSTLHNIWRFTSIVMAMEPQNLSAMPQHLAKGAVDFILLPLDAAEFNRRVLARVGQYIYQSRESTRSLGNLTINLMQRTVSNANESVTLTPIESRIVAALADAPSGVVERHDMKQMCWGDLSITDNALNRKIYEVRRTLRKLSDKINIRTIYGHGFEIHLGNEKMAS